ncbi:DNA-binding WRKY [Macleaya cordata]|uniref:DNA-binding WRKY n=1 Tax=Macleaya cordata TaxID=56857 RepID=A0A200QXE7_MACCD|nr:DNA-binding WRKY [Macleaya cordata]
MLAPFRPVNCDHVWSTGFFDILLSLKAAARSNHQKHELSVQVQDKCASQSSPLVKIKGSSPLVQDSVTAPDPPAHVVSSIASVPMVVDSDESRKRQSPDGGFQATESNHKESSPSIATGRSLEDVYNWRKYGEKHVKGNESSRSYYKCSHPNCEAKKQVVRSYDGQTREITYKGKHDHPTPQPSSEIVVVKPSNGHSQTHHTKPNGTPDPSPITAGDNEGAGAESNRIANEVEDGDDPESARRGLEFNTETTSDASARLNHQQSKPSVEVPSQCESPALGQSPSAKIETATASSNEQTPSVTVPNSPLHVVTSRTIVPVEVDSHELQQRQVLDSIVQAMPSDLKGPLMAAERLSEDGYNWRKYGQKRISGSEFPRSYYRCTHPNCQVKKQLERSHDGKITEIVYKGNHDHPKPQPSSRMVVGTILSIQEESDRVSLNIKKENSSNGHGIASCDTNPKSTHELSNVAASGDGVEGQGPQSHEIGKEVDDDDPDSKGRCLKSNTETSNALEGSNHQQSEPSLQIQVYMVTSRDGLPVDDSDERQQREGSDSGLQAAQSYQKGTSSLIPAERLPDDVYNWRKYGQKHIKGNEFPRSYYRCTYPNCQVKKQLGLSHDGRIIEIIYKGKHDHPKPLPRGAVLSIQEERSDRSSPLNSIKDKPSNEDGQSQTSHYIKIIGANELSIVAASDDDLESGSAQSNRLGDEVDGDDDPQSKRRKKDVDDLDVTAMGRATREPRFVVEKPSEVDVVDDGYRWHKYGRKMVKGNPNPRNYYRCSNSGCLVKKHVERASHNPKLLITTYEGKHNHEMPGPRTSSNDSTGLIDHSTAVDGALKAGSVDTDTNGHAGGVGAGSSPDNIVNEKPQTLDSEQVQDQTQIADTDIRNVVEVTPLAVLHSDDGGAVGDGPREDQDEGSRFDTPP